MKSRKTEPHVSFSPRDMAHTDGYIDDVYPTSRNTTRLDRSSITTAGSHRRRSVSQYSTPKELCLVDMRPSRNRAGSSMRPTIFGACTRPSSVPSRSQLSQYIKISMLEKVDPCKVPYFRRLTTMQRVCAVEMNHWGRRGIGEYVSVDAVAGDKVRGDKPNVSGGTIGRKLDDAELNAEYDAFNAEMGDMMQSTAVKDAKVQFAKTSGAQYDAPKGIRIVFDEAVRNKNVDVLMSLQQMFAHMGYFALAESASHRTLTICQAEFAANAPQVLDCVHNLGVALQKQGLAADAEEFLHKAVSGRTVHNDLNALSGDQHVKPAVESLIALSLCLAQQGKLMEAETHMARAKKAALALPEDDVLLLRASSEMGMILTRRGRLAEAEALLSPLADRVTTICGAAHLDALHNAFNRAALLVELGKQEEAVILAKETLATLEKSFGNRHVDTLRLMRFVAIITDSSELFQQLLVLWRQKCGADHIQYYAALMDVGTLEARNGSLAAARVSFEKAYGGFQKLLGSYHRATTLACSKIGDTFIEEAIPRDADAEWYVRVVFSSVEANFGDNNLETRKAAQNVAVNLFRRFQCDESLKQFKKYILTWVQELSTLTATMDDALCYLALHNYARLLTHMDMRDPSVEEIRRAIWRGWQRILGEEHPNTVMALYSLGETMRDLRHLEEAENILRRVWDMRKKLFGEEDPDTLEAEFGLAATLKLSLRFTDSKVLHDHAYACRLRILGDHHSDTSSSQYYMSLWHITKSEIFAAESLQTLCVTGYEQSFGPDHYWTLNAVNTLGIVHMMLNTHESIERAGECFQRALDGLEKMFGPHHEETSRPICLLAEVKQKQGKVHEGIELRKRTLAIVQDRNGPNAPKTIVTVCQLVSTYNDAFMPDKAAEYYDWILRGWESIRQIPADEVDPRDIRFFMTIKHCADIARTAGTSNVMSRTTSRAVNTIGRQFTNAISLFRA
eukprot:GEMP01008225.1.p1 GENE.GEMP01008225.1~~GEMP01008225.1.p1  ORF type:complete len:962 (+),score=225.12 GEMP01008225.1:495-3380(+)